MTPTASREIERKFDVDAETPLPPLQELPAVSQVQDPEEQELEAVYFDTVDLDLAARRITLRRRTGGADAGWHLKLPTADDERQELAEPLGAEPDHIPEALLQEVRAGVRDRAVVPVARLFTRRTVHPLLGVDGGVLAVFDDDRVHAERLVPTPAGLDWREWEIELVTGETNLLDAAQPLLVEAGARPAEHPSKLAHVLGDRLPAPWPPGRRIPRRKGSGADVLLGYVWEQVLMLGVQDPLVRRDEPDAVHQMRVACRRLRSVLATYRPLLDSEVANQLRAELQWLAGALGAARDIQVIHDRLRNRLAAEPAELIVGPIVERIDEQLAAESHAARVAGLAALDSTRYFRLLDALDEFLAAPPLAEAARKPARRTIPRLIRKEGKKLRALVRMARGTPSGTRARELALHEVRKRAKRLRYAAETAVPVRRKAAPRVVEAAQELQTILGDHQDSVVARNVLFRLSVAAYLRGESGFNYGRLHALEQGGAATSDEMFLLAWSSMKSVIYGTLRRDLS